MRILVEDGVALGFTDLLKDHLLGQLRGDAAQRAGVAIHPDFAPGFNAVLVGCTEFFGGICLVLGLGTRFATVPLTVSMIVAYLTDERATAFKSLDNFTAAAPYQFLLACLVIMAFGPGRVAVDAWFAARLKKRLATQSSR